MPERPLTIVQIAACPYPSGQGSQVYIRGLCEALADEGHRVHLVAYAGGGTAPRGVTLHRAWWPTSQPITGSGLHWSKPLQDLALAAAVRRIVRTERVDVLHGHNVEAPIAGWLSVRRQRPALVYNVHTHMAEELPSYGRGKRVRRALGARVDAWVPQVCDGVVALSERSAAWHAERGFLATHCPPGVHLAELAGADGARARQRWALGDGPWVVYAGNTDAYQDLPDLYAAMAQVTGAGLLVVTGGDADRVRGEAQAAGVERVQVVASGRFADTLDALAAARCAVLPRRVCAGFPIKLLNQLGVGVPTVAAEGSARPIAGVFTVPNGDPRVMAAVIQRLVDEPGHAQWMGEQARLAVAQTWTWSRRARQIVDFYRQLPGVGSA